MSPIVNSKSHETVRSRAKKYDIFGEKCCGRADSMVTINWQPKHKTLQPLPGHATLLRRRFRLGRTVCPRKRCTDFFFLLLSACLCVYEAAINGKLSPGRCVHDSHSTRSGWTVDATTQRCHKNRELTSTIIYAIIYFHDFMVQLLRAMTLRPSCRPPCRPSSAKIAFFSLSFVPLVSFLPTSTFSPVYSLVLVP